MVDFLQKKLNILQKFDIEDVLEFISLTELKRIEKKIETEVENKRLLNKHFKNCVSHTENNITTIKLNSKLVREVFNLKNYSEFKGDWDSDAGYWSHDKQEYAKLGRFHTTLNDYKDVDDFEYVYMYIEIKEGEDPEIEFQKRVDNVYNTDNNVITCQVRDKCVIIYLDWHRDQDIW